MELAPKRQSTRARARDAARAQKGALARASACSRAYANLRSMPYLQLRVRCDVLLLSNGTPGCVTMRCCAQVPRACRAVCVPVA